MGGVESSTGAVIRNGDWEHRICWSEAKPNTDSLEVARTFENGSFIKSNRNSVRKSYSESTNLNKENQDTICITTSERRPSLCQDEIERRLGYKDDSDYWSTPSSSIRYKKGDKEPELDMQIIEGRLEQKTSSSTKLRRSFHKYTGTVIRSPLDRINRISPPRRLLRNDSTDGYNMRQDPCNSTIDMIELTAIRDDSKSVDTCSTTTNSSIKDPYYGVLI